MDLTIAILGLLATTPPEDSGARATRLLTLLTDALSPTAKRCKDSSVRPVTPYDYAGE